MSFIALTGLMFGLATPFMMDPAQAVLVSKDYEISPDEIGVIEKKLQWAAEVRAQVGPNQVISPTVRPNQILINCDGSAPDAEGRGCLVVFFMGCPGMNLMIKKQSIAYGFAAQVASRLKALDPSTHPQWDHVQFGSPFERAAADGTHYYCEPRKTETGSDWKCTLHVSEEFSPRS